MRNTPPACGKQVKFRPPAHVSHRAPRYLLAPSGNLLFWPSMRLPDRVLRSCLSLALSLAACSLTVAPAWSQQASNAPAAASSAPSNNPEFLATADEVLKDMS